MDVDKTDR